MNIGLRELRIAQIGSRNFYMYDARGNQKMQHEFSWIAELPHFSIFFLRALFTCAAIQRMWTCRPLASRNPRFYHSRVKRVSLRDCHHVPILTIMALSEITRVSESASKWIRWGRSEISARCRGATRARGCQETPAASSKVASR